MSRNCIFCDIYTGRKESETLFKDSDIIIFRDIMPAADHHYLVVPRTHIPSVKELTRDQLPLLEKMIDYGKMVLREKGADMSDTRFGFHWPPFRTIPHLHLHAISPTSSMSFLSKLIFKPDSWWFVDPDYVIRRLTRS